MPVKVEAELSEAEDYIRVEFPFDWHFVNAMKGIPGSKFIPQDKGGPAWKLPLDLDMGRALRKAYGEHLTLGPRLAAWGRQETATRASLLSLAAADDAELDRLPKVAPLIHEYISTRPYQRADVSFMAKCKAPLNCNQPGLGKTIETIASIFEMGLDNGPNLIIAPVTSLDVVWEYELLRFDNPHWVLVAPQDREGRLNCIFEAREFWKSGEAFFLVVNPAMVTFRRKGEDLVAPYPEIQEIEWNTVTIDEFHKCGLGNNASLTSKAVKKLTAKKKIAISGTPIQGKPLKLFSILQFLNPSEFTSKWRFADQWLTVGTNGYGKVIGDIRTDRQDAFYEMLSQYMVRRTKADVLSQLPPKQYTEIWATMEGKQATQYVEFARDAEIRIDEEDLSATSILAEYTRLKQFATAEQTILGMDPETKKPILRPTTNSCKLPHLMRILEERGITGDKEQAGDEQVVVFSQFTAVVKMVTRTLQDAGITAEMLTGETTRQERTDLVRKFQAGTGPMVLVMNTMAGGVSITLDRASTVVFLDETWTPDDQEQAEDRVHRGSRIHQVNIYYIRTKDTIEHYIQNLVLDKAEINHKILDLRREGLRATKIA